MRDGKYFCGGVSIRKVAVRFTAGGTHMKYMLLIHDEEQVWAKMSDAERQRIYGEYGQFGQQIKDAGQYLAGAQLQPTSTATSVRVRDGKRLVTDGPFAETREQLGGYYLVEARNLDEAIGIAARIPSARLGTIEVRPVVEMPARAAAATA
jgi:hypothetical protein